MPITEKQRLYNKQWYELHKDEARAYARRRWYENHSHNLARNRAYRKTHKEEARIRTRQWRANIKTEVIAHYGNGKLACVKCGFEDIRALSIDHIDGGGYKHRVKGQGRQGCSFYQQLKNQGYPKGYQTLCMNCQFIKRRVNKEDGS